MSAEFYTACERLLSATANGVYQGVIVTALAALALRWLVRTNAATRHAVWFGVLLFVTALIPAHFLLYGRPRPETAPTVPALASSAPAIAPAPSYDGNTDDSVFAGAATEDGKPDALDADHNIDDTPAPVNDGARDESANVKAVTGGPGGAGAAEEVGSRFAAAFLKPLSWNLEKEIALPHSVCLCVVCGWILLASLRGGLIVRRLVEVRRVKTTSRVPSEGLKTIFDRLRESLAARRNARLRISGTHRTAVVLGFLHPVVLLPAEMDQGANEDEVEHVLRHELAHVDRRDDWGNLAQQVIQTALFFHPAVWWISAKLSLEREIACDDCVLEASGRPRAYALTLANVASRMTRCGPLLAPGVSNNKSQLQQRITMILNTQRDRSPRLARSRLGVLTTATALLAVLAINAGPRLVLAQTPPAAPAEPAPASPAPPPAPNAPSADGLPAALPPDAPSAEAGPRTKPESSSNSAAQPAYKIVGVSAGAVPTQVLVAPVAPVMGARIVSVAAGVPGPDIVRLEPPPPSNRHVTKNMTIEERLDRIESILEDLQAHGGAKVRHHAGNGFPLLEGPVPPNAPFGQPMNITPNFDSQRAAEDAKRAAEDGMRAAEDGKRAAEEGKRAAEQGRLRAEEGRRAAEEGRRAAEQGKRAWEEARRAEQDGDRDMAKLQDKNYQRWQEKLPDFQLDGSKIQIQALRSARESLARELQNIERQIKHLEDAQNRQNKQGRGASDDSDEGSKAEQSAPETK